MCAFLHFGHLQGFGVKRILDHKHIKTFSMLYAKMLYAKMMTLSVSIQNNISVFYLRKAILRDFLWSVNLSVSMVSVTVS